MSRYLSDIGVSEVSGRVTATLSLQISFTQDEKSPPDRGAGSSDLLRLP